MDKTKIIVVEDNIVYCEFVCNMLAREGYRTMKAYHLSTAKKHLQQATDDDIVVSDLRLNDGNIGRLHLAEKEVYKVLPCVLVQLVVEFTEHGYVAVDVRFHHILEDVAHLVVPALLRCRLVSSLCRHIAVVLIFCF